MYNSYNHEGGVNEVSDNWFFCVILIITLMVGIAFVAGGLENINITLQQQHEQSQVIYQQVDRLLEGLDGE